MNTCALKKGTQLCVSKKQKLPSNSTEQPRAFRIVSDQQKAGHLNLWPDLIFHGQGMQQFGASFFFFFETALLCSLG